MSWSKYRSLDLYYMEMDQWVKGTHDKIFETEINFLAENWFLDFYILDEFKNVFNNNSKFLFMEQKIVW